MIEISGLTRSFDFESFGLESFEFSDAVMSFSRKGIFAMTWLDYRGVRHRG